IVGARILTVAGLPRTLAAAAVVADLTAETVSQVVFTFLGLALLIAGRSDVSAEWLLLIIVASIPAIMGIFVACSRRCLALVERGAQGIARSVRLVLPPGRPTLAEAVRSVFRRRGLFVSSSLLHFVAWLIGGLEVWLALRFMGRGVSLHDAVVIESLMWAI